MLTGCGVFRFASDLSFNRSLGATVPSADSSTALATTAAFFESENERSESDRLVLIPDSTLTPSGFVLEPYDAVSATFPLRGRLVSWSSDSTRLHVISDLGYAQSSPVGSNVTIAESLSTQTPCVADVALLPSTVPSDGSAPAVFATAPANCLWQATSPVSWIQIRTRVSLGSAALDVSVLPNPDPGPREALVTMGGKAVRIVQAARSLVLSPDSLSLSAMPSQASVQIIASDRGLRWTAVAQVPWISLLQTSGVASASLTFSVAPNPGPARVGTFTVNTVVFTVVQSGGGAAGNQPPVVLPPLTGSTVGAFAQRSFRFADPDGVADLAILSVLINTSLDGRDACHFAYDIRSSLLYLVARDGIGASTSLIGVPGTLSNGICRIDTQDVQFSRDAHSATLTVAYFVEPLGFVGRAIYGAARDRQGNNSGWQLIGHHNLFTAIPTNPTNSIVSPPNPNSPLSIRYNDIHSTTGDPSSTNIKFAQVLIQNTLDARRACYIGFDHNNNLLYLMNDDGTRLLPSAIRLNGAPGGLGFVENSQCRVDATGSSFTNFATALGLTLNIAYKSSFSGPRLIYAGAQTPNSNSGWQMVGFLALP